MMEQERVEASQQITPPRDDQRELAQLLARHAPTDGAHQTAIPSLHLYRSANPHLQLHAVYDPSLCLVVQGCKVVLLGNEELAYTPDHYLLVSVSMPITSRITEASASQPYLALKISFDPNRLVDLLTMEPPISRSRREPQRGLTVGSVDASLCDAATRLVRLLDMPQHIPVLAPLILREIAYLLLVGAEGAAFHEMALARGTVHRIAQIIARLRQAYAEPVKLDTLAREVGMSVSSLHAHFKAVTAMSPLQYLKQVRLQEARRLMLSENLDIASASLRVGYESHSQFSREYRRLFGAAPSRDMARLRTPGNEEERSSLGM